MISVTRIKELIDAHRVLTAMLRDGDHTGAGLTISVCVGNETDDSVPHQLKTCLLTTEVLTLLAATQKNSLVEQVRLLEASILDTERAIAAGRTYLDCYSVG